MSNISPRHNIKIEGPVCIVVGCLALPCCQYRFRHSRWTIRTDAKLKKKGRSERRKKKISRKKAFLTTASRDEERDCWRREIRNNVWSCMKCSAVR